MNENEQFIDAVKETYKNFGIPPKIGSFVPCAGDIGMDQDGGKWCVFDGAKWLIPSGPMIARDMVVEEHYSPSKKETLRIFKGNIPPIQDQMRWFDDHPDSILIWIRE